MFLELQSILAATPVNSNECDFQFVIQDDLALISDSPLIVSHWSDELGRQLTLDEMLPSSSTTAEKETSMFG